jgi:RecA/RadA recombinase
MKIGVMYGNPETTSGGQALKFYSHQRIEVRKKGQIKVKEGADEVVVGQVSSVKFVKNKTARPFGQCEFKVIFDATALNPVVMLANSLKTAKLIKVYKGVYNIPPDTIDNKDKIETGATTMPEMANFIIKNKLVVPLIDALIENALDTSEIDGAILEMKEDPTKIVSPSNEVILDAEKIDDAKPTDEELAEAETDVPDVSAEE